MPLRRAFETKFSDPRATRSDRFVWDPWNIESQYSVLRTPARHFFPKAVFDRFHEDLQNFGRRELGCNGISDPWLSLYVDGSYQNLHSDSPHGPWAYVFSLTKWKARNFRGGETLIARDRLLDFWPAFASEGRDRRGIEFDDFFRAVPAEFNQLLAFDPRLPHGVRELRGTREPLEGRLVIHGWFVEPRPFVEGGLGRSARTLARTERALAGTLEPLSRELARISGLRGTLAVRLSVSKGGRPGRQELVANTLIDAAAPANSERPLEAMSRIASALSQISLPRVSDRSEITIPFLFR